MFQSWGSKSASEAGQAAARNVDQAVPPARANDDQPLQDAGKFIIKDAAGNVLAALQSALWRMNTAPTTTGLPDVDDMTATSIDLSIYFADDFDDPTDLTYTVESNTDATITTRLFRAAWARASVVGPGIHSASANRAWSSAWQAANKASI